MYYIIALFVIVFAVVFWIVAKNKSRDQTTNADNSVIFIVGDKNAGKTSLLINQTKQLKCNCSRCTRKQLSKRIVFKQNIRSKENNISYRFTRNCINRGNSSYLIQYFNFYSIQKSRIPILIVLNKQDKEKAYKAPDFEMFLSREIEKIKKSRKEVQEQRENTNDRIRFQENQFDVNDYPTIKTVEQSVKDCNIQEVQKFIFN
ncbi:unnamed protein product [Paramecium octaurelia]|uniref:Signal recognition particle receptor subunit beta n=1 Tax=Paramecium octaurelia TaxID=43137 RepID=A0A8S1XB87_PAROT|nr:unnamed protein product [Paramecium octaurelia]